MICDTVPHKDILIRFFSPVADIVRMLSGNNDSKGKICKTLGKYSFGSPVLMLNDVLCAGSSLYHMRVAKVHIFSCSVNRVKSHALSLFTEHTEEDFQIEIFR